MGLILACVGILSLSCTNETSREAEGTEAAPWRLSLVGGVDLADGTDPVLAKPGDVVETRDGVIVIADQSDHDVKLYQPDGRRLTTAGRPGSGPGEFNVLSSLGLFGDSLLVNDFATQRLTVLSAHGVFSRTAPIAQSWVVRTVDDSLLLLIRHPGQAGPLLALATIDGDVIRQFFDRPWLSAEPALRFHSAVYADARDGFVFASLFGDDSLFVMDYSGRSIATMSIPGVGNLVKAWIDNDRKDHRPDGRWFHDSLPAVMGVTALNGGRAVITTATYDTKVGTDLVEGAMAVTVAVDRRGRSALTSQALPGYPAGRGTSGDELLVIRYREEGRDGYRVEHWTPEPKDTTPVTTSPDGAGL